MVLVDATSVLTAPLAGSTGEPNRDPATALLAALASREAGSTGGPEAEGDEWP
jgi:hypothetical protein